MHIVQTETNRNRYVSWRFARRFVSSIIVMVLSAIALSGCGSGSGGGTALTPGVPLTVGTQTSFTAGALVSQVLSAPLPNATITVYNFQTGQIIAHGATDNTGYGTVVVTPGLCVAIVVTGSDGGTNYRLSTIIPTVPNINSSVLVTPATTLATEALASVYFGKQVVDQAAFGTVMNSATAFFSAHPGSSVSLGGGLINAGTLFGANSLSSQVSSVVTAAKGVAVTTPLGLSKNAVAEARELGNPIIYVAGQEEPELVSIGDKIINTLKGLNLQSVLDKYQGVVVRYSEMLSPAMNQTWQYTANGVTANVSIFDLTVGHGYQVTWQGNQPVLTDDVALNTSGQITVTEQIAGATMKLVAIPQGNNIWKLTQTSTDDPQLLYQLTVPHKPGSVISGANPSASIQASFMDGTLTTPITFSGTISANGPSINNYTQYNLSGTLGSDNVNGQADITINFATSLPAGSPSGSTIDNYPISFLMNNASLTLSDGSVSATISGMVSATMQITSTTSGPIDQLSGFEVKGTTSVTGPDGTGSLTGDTIVTAGYPAGVHSQIPTSVQFKNSVSFTLTFGTATIQGSGSLQIGIARATINGSSTVIPTSISLQGNYNDSATGVSFSGDAHADLNNFTPGSTLVAATASGSFTLVGQLQQQGYQAYNVDVALDVVNGSSVTLTVNKLEFGYLSLKGSGSGTLASVNGKVKLVNGQLNLVNESGVTFQLVTNAQGVVSGVLLVGSKQTATISESGGVATVTFSDGSTSTLF